MRSVVVENRLCNAVWTVVICSTGTTSNSLCRFAHISYFDKVQFRDFLANAVNLSEDKCPCLWVPKYPGPAHEHPARADEEVGDGEL